MSLSHGSKTVMGGLVLAVDAASKKSWKGEPTENILPTNLSTYVAQNGVSVSTTGEYYQNNPVYRISFPGGTLPRIFWEFAYTDGETYTGSIHYRYVKYIPGNQTPRMFFRERSFGANYASDSFSNTDLSSNWTQSQVTHTFSGSGVCMFLLYQSTSSNTDEIIIDFALPQCEQKGYSTPFVNGVRSDTQAIIDWAGRNTLTTSLANYNNGNPFNFDGTVNGIDCGPDSSLKPSRITCEAVVRHTNPTQSISFIMGHGDTGFNGYFIAYNPISNSIRFSVQTNGTNSGAQFNSPTIPNLNSTTSHVVCTFDGSNARIYHNGLLVSTHIVDGEIDYTGITSSSFKLGDIGADGSQPNMYWTGDVYLAKLYNRALSGIEVHNNFNSIRGRFNL